MQIKVYVIIVTYNAMKWVDRCLGSLRDSTMPAIPVVIDNLSKDGTVEYIRKNYPEAHLIVNKENHGFGQGNNQGIEWAYKQGGTHFFLLNQDAWVYKDTIGNLVKVQDENQIALVSPIHMNGEGARMDYNAFLCTVIQPRNIDLVSHLLTGKLRDYYEIPYINAAAWMISRDLVETIGGFDPVFFQYGEDVQYSQRMKYHKLKTAVVPQAFICHDRKLYGNITVFQKNVTYRLLLLRACDINHPLVCWDRNVINVNLNITISIVRNFFTFHWGRVITTFGEIFRFYGQLPNIIRSRRENKKVGAHWLELEDK